MEPKEILVRSGGRTKAVPTEDVYYVESNNRKVVLHTKWDEIEYYAKISELESFLKPDFYRIHKGYLVHMKYIQDYERTSVSMKNGDSLLISKYRYQEFVKAYQNYREGQEAGN